MKYVLMGLLALAILGVAVLIVVGWYCSIVAEIESLDDDLEYVEPPPKVSR